MGLKILNGFMTARLRLSTRLNYWQFFVYLQFAVSKMTLYLGGELSSEEGFYIAAFNNTSLWYDDK